MKTIRDIRDIEVAGKRVLVRVDFNVFLDPATGAISDDSRLRACLPTLKYLTQRRARVILCSHLGRPEGQRVAGLSLAPIASRLSQLLGQEIKMAPDSSGKAVKAMVAGLKEGQVMLLENIRFQPGEEKNDPALAQALAQLADLFVNEAFSVSHRVHASTVGVARYLPAVAGLLLEREVEMLGKVLHPERPFATLLGGAKVKDKTGVLDHILDKVDRILIGGGMAAPFIHALGYSVGSTLSQGWELCREIMGRAEALRKPVILPRDVVVAPRLEAGAETQVVAVDAIPPWGIIGDIGPKTVELFSSELGDCRTILWNGPMGVFELPQFAAGTRALAQFLAKLQATTIVGGGSTAEMVQELGLASRMSHVSTGGGASLEFLEGKTLPGIAVLEQ